ncbi:MAG TPA: ADOP family duplicated permease [Longimicrobiales bacterium]|nr:ADOP family duplicated permease [Longimicrobiales bacterium]
MSQEGRSVRLYRLLLRLLPPRVRRQDAEEMAGALADQLEDAPHTAARRARTWRAFRRLPGAVAAEWIEELRGGPVRGPASTRTGRWQMGEWMRRIQMGVRSLGRSPAFTWSSILLVGVGVGAVTTVFTVVDHVMLRPLPYPDEDRLVYMTNGSHPGPILRALDDLETVESWTAVYDQDTNLEAEGGDPLRLRQADVTPSFFPLFGARPTLGRLLVAADGNDHGLAVLTHEAWTSVWGADPEIVGRSVRLDGEPVEVVGVLDASFVAPEPLVGRTIHVLRLIDWTDPALQRPNVHRHSVVARLEPGISLEVANQELDQMAITLDEQYPDMLRGREGNLRSIPFERLREYTVQGASRGLGLLLGAVGLLLLVACANVAHLFLARGLSRRREMAVRQAMGARTGALLGQLSVESLAVGVGGALLGLGIAAVALRALAPWMQEGLPRGTAVTLDLRILLFAAGLAVLTALLFGLVPAIRALGRDVSESLRGGGRGVTQSRSVQFLRSGLVAGEVALSLVLVTMSGILLRSFLEVTAEDPGLRVAETWVIPVDFPTDPEVGAYAAAMEEIRAALATVPGVGGVTYGMEAPFEWVGGNTCCWGTRYGFEDVPADDLGATVHAVDEGFFDTYGMELLAGGVWPASETEPSPLPVILSEALALELFGSPGAAVGRNGTLGAGDSPRNTRVVGVVADTRYYGLDQGVDESLYVPVEALAFPLDIGTFGVHAVGAGDGFAQQLREAVWQVRPALPLPTVQPLDEWLRESSAVRRFMALVVVAFGAVALLLAAGGLYGTLLYAVHQRRKELGIRLALGAGRGRIEGDVVRRGVALAVLGAAIGGVAAWASGRLLENLVYGVGPQDPLSLALAVALLLGTAALASWFPARRASRTDPLETLSAE